MKKIFIFVFLLLFLFPFIKPPKAEAIIQEATGLAAISSCNANTGSTINDQSTITFEWNYTNDTSVSYDFLFWKTGDSSETTIDPGTCVNYQCKVVANSLPQNKTYDWYVKTHDTGFCLFNCDNQVNGPTVLSPTCPPTGTTKWSCDSQSYACIQSTNGNYATQAGCQSACKPAAPENVYNCEDRDPKCPATTYPNCKTWPDSYTQGFSCDGSSYCTMAYTPLGTDKSAWTRSCAWKNGATPPSDPQPPTTVIPTSTNPYNVSPPPPPCATPLTNGNCPSVASALGINIPTDAAGFIKTMFGVLLSIIGAIAVILIIISGYRLIISQGNPEKLQGAREQLTAAIIGLLFIIFSFVFLQIIGIDILGLPPGP